MRRSWRAQDLGPRNAELINYYAARQPGREFYLLDRDSGKFYDFGPAKELGKRLPQ